MAMFPAASRRRFAPGISSMPALLATTSVAALLLGTPLPAHAAGISVTGNAANVDNPANTTVTSIVVNAANVSGVQDRLVANGGALGEWSLPGAPSAGAASPLPIGHANVWARGYDQFGSASASAAIGAVGYGINRAAPLIGGID
ncbi:MAG TPA: hypothetical protein VG124_09770 [Beijerinckiaceae bacterium]|nr:hypothetical protein [Beijerinckiaceae bacterium]